MSYYHSTGSVDISDIVLDQLISEIAMESKKALESLYQMTSRSVYGFILSSLKNTHDAEDALHDCYVSIYSSAKNYHSAGRPMAWILAIARNVCLMRMREQRRSTSVPYEDWESSFESQNGISMEEKMLLHACLKKLSADENQIVWLHAVSGFKHREIAHMMGMPLATVLSKYHRALKKLKASIEKGESEHEK